MLCELDYAFANQLDSFLMVLIIKASQQAATQTESIENGLSAQPMEKANYATAIRPIETTTTTMPPAMPIMNAIYSNPPTAATCRRSASMESIPSQQQHQRFTDMATNPNESCARQPPVSNHYQQHLLHGAGTHRSNHIINIYNKYGTVGGYSTSNSSNRTNTRPSLLIQQSNAVANTSLANSSGGSGTVPNSESNSQVNSRLRPVNRSFRTAVDKSFDLPNTPITSGKSVSPFSQAFCFSHLDNRVRLCFINLFSFVSLFFFRLPRESRELE